MGGERREWWSQKRVGRGRGARAATRTLALACRANRLLRAEGANEARPDFSTGIEMRKTEKRNSCVDKRFGRKVARGFNQFSLSGGKFEFSLAFASPGPEPNLRTAASWQPRNDRISLSRLLKGAKLSNNDLATKLSQGIHRFKCCTKYSFSFTLGRLKK